MWFYDYCIRRYCSFYLFHETTSVTFLSLFCSQAFHVYLLLFYQFLNKVHFLKDNFIYDWYMIYPHFVIWKKIIKM